MKNKTSGYIQVMNRRGEIVKPHDVLGLTRQAVMTPAGNRARAKMLDERVANGTYRGIVAKLAKQKAGKLRAHANRLEGITQDTQIAEIESVDRNEYRSAFPKGSEVQSKPRETARVIQSVPQTDPGISQLVSAIASLIGALKPAPAPIVDASKEIVKAVPFLKRGKRTKFFTGKKRAKRALKAVKGSAKRTAKRSKRGVKIVKRSVKQIAEGQSSIVDAIVPDQSEAQDQPVTQSAFPGMGTETA